MEGHGHGRSARPSKLAVLALALVLALLPVAPARAQGEAWVRFGAMSQEVTFGRQVVFHLAAESDRPPDSVWLIYQLAGEQATNSAKADFNGEKSITAIWRWVLDPGEMAPGDVVRYRWAVEDADGNRVESQEQSFSYDDSRFKWQQLQKGDLTVYYYKDAQSAQQVLDAGTAALARLQTDVGAATTRPVRMYVYASKSDMALAIPPRSQSFDAQTITLGMAMGKDALVLLGGEADLSGTVAHELSHVVVHQLVDNPFSQLPPWLDEGLAMYAEGALPPRNASALQSAIRSGRLLSLQSMTSYPGDPRLVDLFYGEVYSVVNYMISTYGRDKMQELLAGLGEGQPFEESLQQAYGLTEAELQSQWFASLGVTASVPAATPSQASGKQPSATAAPGVTGTALPIPTPPPANLPVQRKPLLPCGATLLPLVAIGVWGLSRRRAA